MTPLAFKPSKLFLSIFQSRIGFSGSHVNPQFKEDREGPKGLNSSNFKSSMNSVSH